MSNKLSSKKRRQINKSKQKASIEDTNSRNTSINDLNSFDKKQLLASIPVQKKL